MATKIRHLFYLSKFFQAKMLKKRFFFTLTTTDKTGISQSVAGFQGVAQALRAESTKKLGMSVKSP